MDGAEPGQRRVPQRLDRRPVGHVGCHREHRGAGFGDAGSRLGQRRLLDVGQHHVQALGREAPGQPEPDPTGGAGDDGHPTRGDRTRGAEQRSVRYDVFGTHA
jgi:hypothetical protein